MPLIDQILIYYSTGDVTYNTYEELIAAREAYWDVENQDTAKRFRLHHEIVHASEDALESLHGFERGQLRGMCLAFGSIRDMRENLEDPHLRDIIKDDRVRFRIRIGVARYADTDIIDYTEPGKDWRIYFRLKHNLYGESMYEDTFAEVA